MLAANRRRGRRLQNNYLHRTEEQSVEPGTDEYFWGGLLSENDLYDSDSDSFW